MRIFALLITVFVITACETGKRRIETVWNPDKNQYEQIEVLENTPDKESFSWTDFFLFLSRLSANSNRTTTNQDTTSKHNDSVIKHDTYGPGIHMDKYGRPVRLEPASKGDTGYYGDSYIKQPNAYGPDIHMDQYGRPVKVVPK